MSEMRLTPSQALGGACPAQVFHRRMPRGMLPTLVDNTDYQKSMAYRAIYLEKMAADIKARANASEKLDVGDAVRIENHISGLWNKTGVIEAVRDHGKSYLVANDEGGRLILRNRRHIKRMEPSEMDLVAGGNGSETATGGFNTGDMERFKNLERVVDINKAALGNPSRVQDSPWMHTRSHGAARLLVI